MKNLLLIALITLMSMSIKAQTADDLKEAYKAIKSIKSIFNKGKGTNTAEEKVTPTVTPAVGKTSSKSVISTAENSVTLLVTGQGKTTDEANDNALRSAIEQAFGTFISSKTEVLKDNLIKDEIISVSNGNIQKYDLVSSQRLLNGFYENTLKATVSIAKLTAFSESKGLSVEFKGGLFAANILLKELYDKNELIAWQNTKGTVYNFIKNGFDYSIEASSPVLLKGNIYKVPLLVTSKFNSNCITALNIIYDFMKASSMSASEAEDYINLGKKVYPLIIAITKEKYGKFYFRNEVVRDEISRLPKYLFKSSLDQIKLRNDVEEFSLKSYLQKGLKNETALPIYLVDNFKTYKSFFSQNQAFGLWGNNNATTLILEFKNDNSYYVKDEIYITGRNISMGNSYGTEKLSEFDLSDLARIGYTPSNGNTIEIIFKEYFGNNTNTLEWTNFQFIRNLNENEVDKVIFNDNNQVPAISFISILKKGELFQLGLEDLRSLDELKQISKYDIQKY
jgi:hypothetical protein